MIFSVPIFEGSPSAFKNVHDLLVDIWVLDGPALIGNFELVLSIKGCVNNLFGVAYNCEVWVMGNHQYLSFFSLPELRPELTGSRLFRYQDFLRVGLI